MHKILIVGENDKLCLLFGQALGKKGYEIDILHNTAEALQKLCREDISLLICQLPEPETTDFVQALRADHAYLPVMMIIQDALFVSRRLNDIPGLQEPVIQPVDLANLVSRADRLIKQYRRRLEGRQVIGQTVLERDALTVRTGSSALSLPKFDFMLLYELLSSPGKIFTNQQLLAAVWGSGQDRDGSVVDACVARLRKVLQENRDFQIISMRGLGYKAVTA